jgi:hypothetical protein
MLDEIESLKAEDLELVVGGVVTGGAGPIVICKLPADSADTTCGTKGPGPHVPVLSWS